MNLYNKQRWGLKVCIIVCAFFLTIGGVFAYSSVNSYMKAETAVIDDGPSGEKIVDIAQGSGSMTHYALTEEGEVYAWGYNSVAQLGNGAQDSTALITIPRKVLNADNAKNDATYLSNIKKIYAGGTSSLEGRAMALDNDGTLYAWGDNSFNELGISNSKVILKPSIVEFEFDSEIIDIIISYQKTLILTESGSVYISGMDGGSYGTLGLGDAMVGQKTNGFTRIEKDNQGNALPPIKDAHITNNSLYLISETNLLYVSGIPFFSGTKPGVYDRYISAPTLAVLEDGQPIQNVSEFVLVPGSEGPAVVLTNNGEYYTTYGYVHEAYKYVVELKSLSRIEDPNSYFFDNLKGSNISPGSTVYLGNDNKLYFLQNYDGAVGLRSEVVYPQPYKAGEITESYSNAQKIMGINGKVQSSSKLTNVLLLSNHGGVYLDGAKVTFGDVFVKAQKEDASTYKNNEKYNDTITLNVSSTYPISDIRYTSKNLLTNVVSEVQSTTGSINITLNDEERFYQTYEFYVEGKEQETKTSFTVDLYKKTPIVTDIKNNGRYMQNKTIELKDNGFTGNTVTATISKDAGEASEYESNSPITELGNYSLTVTDLYGNTNQYAFTITNQAGPESVLFTPTNADLLYVGSDITGNGDIIGTLSLTYPAGSTAYAFDTIALGTERDEAHFEITNGNQLKVIGSDLIAGTYELDITGTDTNGMEFSGTITITIAKVSQTMDWNDKTKAWKDSGITKNDTITVGVKNVLENAAVTYGIKGTNSCVSVNPMTGALSISCVPEDKQVTMTARSEATASYDTKTIEITLPFQHEYTALEVNVTSEGTAYTGGWTKHDVTFTVSGGLSEDELEGYEYAITDGTKPNASITWNTMTNDTLTLTNNVTDQTYWFRALPSNDKSPISKGFKVNLDVDIPAVPTMTMEEINHTKMAQFINLFSFGNWMNKEAKVTMTATDPTSGIDHYEYMEDTAAKQSTTGILTYGDGTELSLKARACDKAGNCSSYGDSETIQIDMKAPTITGVKDQAEYKQYYLPRFFKVEDGGSGLAKAEYSYDSGTPIDITTSTTETKVKEEGTYQIKAKDHAGNEVTLTFKIMKLPNIETEIDGTDESKEIICQIQKEYDEGKDRLDSTEKTDIEQWIKDATEKWEKSRKKVFEDDETTSKVEGQGDTSFDPNTELIVEEIPESEIPQLPKKALNVYDVYLKKGNTVIQPDGSIKVYLPYNANADPIVYEIDEDEKITTINVKKEDGYVTFITDTLMKYAISDSKQEDIEKEVCVVGPDSKTDTTDDVCGEGNEAGDSPIKGPDGSVEIPEGGKVVFPNGNEVELPDGGIIHPDGSVTLPDGTELSPEGDLIDKPDEPDSPAEDPEGNKKPTEPDQKEPICTAGPDGRLGTSDDVCGEGNDKGEEPSKKPNGDVEIPDGGSVVFPSGNEVELPDGGTIHPDGSVTLPDGTELSPEGDLIDKPDEPDSPAEDPNGNKKDPDQGKCKLEGTILNKDTDGDGIPDLNIDFDGDCVADINIDIDNDGIPDTQIDTDGDGKADINIDVDKDGKADINIIKLEKWMPNKDDCYYNGKHYDTMSGLKPDLNVDDNGDGEPDRNIDDDGDGIPDRNIDPDWFERHGKTTSVKGTYDKNTGGVNTGDVTKWHIWWILLIATSVTMSVSLYHKYRKFFVNKN